MTENHAQRSHTKLPKPGKSCARSETVLNLDSFGQPINFNLPDGNPNLRAPLGACLNVLITVTIWLYFGQGLVVLLARDASSFTSSV